MEEALTNLERIYVTKNGKKIPVSFSVALLKNVNDKTEGAVCLSQDITIRKEIEEERKNSLEEKKVMLKEIHFYKCERTI